MLNTPAPPALDGSFFTPPTVGSPLQAPSLMTFSPLRWYGEVNPAVAPWDAPMVSGTGPRAAAAGHVATTPTGWWPFAAMIGALYLLEKRRLHIKAGVSGGAG